MSHDSILPVNFAGYPHDSTMFSYLLAFTDFSLDSTAIIPLSLLLPSAPLRNMNFVRHVLSLLRRFCCLYCFLWLFRFLLLLLFLLLLIILDSFWLRFHLVNFPIFSNLFPDSFSFGQRRLCSFSLSHTHTYTEIQKERASERERRILCRKL